ncbi:hypothetical protein [Pararhodobacter oceanensis]|uniref:hypothetical protein n=1 Tax=Pararhodobacter oceanensis TaxID=2172121 RepID=UPI003A8E5825
MLIRQIALPLCLLLAPLPLAAQDGLSGIAFVQAPEMSSGMALAQTPADAFAAATAECTEGGAETEDCIPTNWCQPAGFSIDLFVMHTEGLHWHEVTCGLPTEEIARATAAAICTQGARPWIADCQLVQIYDRDGQPQM